MQVSMLRTYTSRMHALTDFVKPATLATELDLSEETVRRWCRLGLIPGALTLPNGQWFLPPLPQTLAAVLRTRAPGEWQPGHRPGRPSLRPPG